MVRTRLGGISAAGAFGQPGRLFYCPRPEKSAAEIPQPSPPVVISQRMGRFDSRPGSSYTRTLPLSKAHANGHSVTDSRYHWAAKGDVNAFFGLMLDNVANLLLTVSLLYGAFAFPAKVALRNMIPGTAMGVLVGDLLFFWLALRLAKKTGKSSITAMPLGLDTPSTFGMRR